MEHRGTFLETGHDGCPPVANTGLFQRSTRLRRRSERLTSPALYAAFIKPIPVVAEVRFAPHVGRSGEHCHRLKRTLPSTDDGGRRCAASGGLCRICGTAAIDQRSQTDYAPLFMRPDTVQDQLASPVIARCRPCEARPRPARNRRGSCRATLCGGVPGNSRD